MIKPTVVVIGLLPGQTHAVAREVGSNAHIRFVQSKGKTPHIPTGQHCFLLKKFIAHCWTRQAYLQFGRSNVTLVNGGVTDLTRTILTLTKGTNGHRS